MTGTRTSNFDSPDVLEKLEERIHLIFEKVAPEKERLINS